MSLQCNVESDLHVWPTNGTDLCACGAKRYSIAPSDFVRTQHPDSAVLDALERWMAARIVTLTARSTGDATSPPTDAWANQRLAVESVLAKLASLREGK